MFIPRRLETFTKDTVGTRIFLNPSNSIRSKVETCCDRVFMRCEYTGRPFAIVCRAHFRTFSDSSEWKRILIPCESNNRVGVYV